MKWIDRLEPRFGRFAVPNATLLIIVGQAAAFLAATLRGPDVLNQLFLMPDMVLQGEVWRLVTFLFMPPSLTILWALIHWYVLYLMGTAIEQHYGAFRYNVYLGIFWLASIAAGMLAPTIPIGPQGGLGQTGYLTFSLLIAFAYLFPNFTFHLFFILPIRVKWLALIAWITLAYVALRGGWGARAMVAATILNFVVFFSGDILRTLADKRRRAAFEARVQSVHEEGKPRHKCTVCGVTNLDNPQMQFRYCSKCAGHPCYCMDHLQNHEHIREDTNGTPDQTPSSSHEEAEPSTYRRG